MGAFLSNSGDTTGSQGAPKSFYLVLGGPSIRYNRPGRGPLIFDVDPMRTNGDDLVEHAEVVRPTANVSAKQKFLLVPSFSTEHGTTAGSDAHVLHHNTPAAARSAHTKFRLQFSVEYTVPPQSVEVFVDVQVVYRQGEGIVLQARNPSATTGPTTAPSSDPTRVMAVTTFPTPNGACDMLQYCAEFSVDNLVPALRKDQLTTPCSLKECPMVVVVQFDVPPAQCRRNPATSPTTPMEESTSDLTAVHRVYTFLTFDEKQLHATFAGGGGGGRRQPAAGQQARDEDVELGEVRHPQATVVKQYLEFSGEVYELDDIYDLGGDDLAVPAVNPAGDGSATPRGGGVGGAETGDDAVETIEEGDDDDANNCVICLCNPKDTTVIPCRHLCLCSECAVQLRHQSNKCPICRRPIERLMTM